MSNVALSPSNVTFSPMPIVYPKHPESKSLDGPYWVNGRFDQTTEDLINKLEESLYGTQADAESNLEGLYIVWSPGATQPPKQTYKDRPTAIKVALSMSKRNPGSQFAVCKIVGTAKVTKSEYRDFE